MVDSKLLWFKHQLGLQVIFVKHLKNLNPSFVCAETVAIVPGAYTKCVFKR